MSGVSLPVNRPVGRTLVVGNSAGRGGPIELLLRLGYHCTEMDDPYAAMSEVCRRPFAFRSVVLCLNSIYREELPVIAALKRRFSHVEVWLTQSDGRPAALAEASRLGADGLLSNEGLHLFAVGEAERHADPLPSVEAVEEMNGEAALGQDDAPLVDMAGGEPVLTAEELRALLQEPIRPQRSSGM